MKTCKLLLLALCCGCISASAAGKAGSEAPRIVNIVNFIRNIEPRSEEITETVLYETVARQAAQLAEYLSLIHISLPAKVPISISKVLS